MIQSWLTFIVCSWIDRRFDDNLSQKIKISKAIEIVEI